MDSMGLGRSNFLEHLIAYNALGKEGFSKWVFYPGMLFNATEKWWGEGGRRKKPHEGLDIGLYQNLQGHICCFDSHIKVPVIYKGRVESIIDDYLGKTVYVRHPIHNGKSLALYSVYGHIDPYAGICPGVSVESGCIIASITDTKGKKFNILPHLHISIAWIPSSLSQEKLNWKLMADASQCTLLNPLTILTCEFALLKQG